MITIVAHRGASLKARENTIESFLAAVDLGADMVELDIRKCGDGSLVVFHDPRFSRGGRSGLISRLPFRELNRLAAKKGFSVPSMETAFKTLSGKITLDIELKEPGYEEEVVACAREYFDDSQFVLTSFNPRVITAIKAFGRNLQTGFIMATAEGLALAETSPAEVLAPDKKLFSANRGLFARAKKQGKKIAVWTVDGIELLARLLIDPIVDAIITNRPDRALALRDRLTDRY
jgi:glycerophosphoryl diester phosphodiesterase